jgi:hypothetical protein
MEDEMDRACSTYMGNAYTISVENPKVKTESGDVDGDNINVDLLKHNVKMWTRFNSLMIGTSCRLFRKW